MIRLRKNLCDVGWCPCVWASLVFWRVSLSSIWMVVLKCSHQIKHKLLASNSWKVLVSFSFFPLSVLALDQGDQGWNQGAICFSFFYTTLYKFYSSSYYTPMRHTGSIFELLHWESGSIPNIQHICFLVFMQGFNGRVPMPLCYIYFSF